MNEAIILLSGGMDSTICLYWAKKNFSHVEAITFDYMQRHQREIQSAVKIAYRAKVDHKIIQFPTLGEILDTALTREEEVEIKDGLPTTWVPNRNLIFLALASAYGRQKNICNYVSGMCQADFSGYPDCRRETIDSFEQSLSLSLEKPIKIYTPLMYQTKAQSLRMAQQMDGCMEALAFSHTCYYGKQPACGKCPACKLRLKAFQEIGLKDVIEYERMEI